MSGFEQETSVSSVRLARLNAPIYKNIFVREVVLMLHKKSECKSFAHFAQAKNRFIFW